MDFTLTAEQTGFAQSLSALMSGADPVAAARGWAVGDTEPGLALWKRLADQGVTALVVPEEHGGLGGTAVDLVVAFEVLGHHLAVGPWIESAAFLARALDGEALEAVAGGTTATVALAPLVPFALDAHVVEQVHVVRDGTLDTVAAPPLSAALRSVDTTRHLFEVTPGGRAASAATDQSRPSDQSRPVDPRLADALDHAVLACAAELLGCGERLLADTVGYAKQRRQYGRTVGSYQAVKHVLADVRIALDFARPLVHGAALAIGTDDGPRAVSAAKVATGDAAYLSSRVALQLHGAIGYTAEFDLGLWINRVRALVGAWGGASHHRAVVAESLGAG